MTKEQSDYFDKMMKELLTDPFTPSDCKDDNTPIKDAFEYFEGSWYYKGKIVSPTEQFNLLKKEIETAEYKAKDYESRLILERKEREIDVRNLSELNRKHLERIYHSEQLISCLEERCSITKEEYDQYCRIRRKSRDHTFDSFEEVVQRIKDDLDELLEDYENR
jgi:hypothetical protein